MTARSLLARRPGRRELGLAVLGGGVQLAVGAAVVKPQLRPLLVPLMAAGGMALVFTFPYYTVCLGLLLVDSVFYESEFAISAGSFTVHPSEVILGALLIVAVLRPVRMSWGGVAGGALAVFLALVTFSTALAVTEGRATLAEALDLWRPFMLLAFFYVVVRLAPDATAVGRLLKFMAVLGAVTGVVALVVGLTSGESSALQDPGKNFINASQGVGSFARVRLPGLALSYLLFWFTLARATGATGERRWLWGAVLAGTVANIAVSFNRNMWVGLMIGLAVVLVAGGARLRQHVVAGLAVGAAAIVLLTLSGPETSGQSALTPLAKRADTILHPARTANEQSLRDRSAENTRAWSAVKHRLLTGLGPGVPWGTFNTVATSPNVTVRTPQLFLHNQYLYLIVVGGIPALLAFVGFLLATLRDSWRPVGRDPTLRACGIGIVMTMVSAVVMIDFSVRYWTLPIGLVAGCVAILARQSRA